MAFTVTCTQRQDLVRVRLSGELDLATVPALNSQIDQLFADGVDHLLIDLTELTFCDSTGLAAFVRGDNQVAARGGWLRVTGASGRVERVLRISGLAELLGYEGDPDVPPGG